LDPDYVVLTHDLARGPTGLLKIFSLQPNTAGKPSFEARLDDGSPGKRKPIELDFDINELLRDTSRLIATVMWDITVTEVQTKRIESFRCE
jgi:hypothetical protein